MCATGVWMVGVGLSLQWRKYKPRRDRHAHKGHRDRVSVHALAATSCCFQGKDAGPCRRHRGQGVHTCVTRYSLGASQGTLHSERVGCALTWLARCWGG